MSKTTNRIALGMAYGRHVAEQMAETGVHHDLANFHPSPPKNDVGIRANNNPPQLVLTPASGTI